MQRLNTSNFEFTIKKKGWVVHFAFSQFFKRAGLTPQAIWKDFIRRKKQQMCPRTRSEFTSGFTACVYEAQTLISCRAVHKVLIWPIKSDLTPRTASKNARSCSKHILRYLMGKLIYYFLKWGRIVAKRAAVSRSR